MTLNLVKMRKQNLRDFADIQTAEFDRLVEEHEVRTWQFWVRDRWDTKYGDKAGIIHIIQDDLHGSNKIRVTMKLRRPNEAQVPS